MGQEKLVPIAPWGSIAFAGDWVTAARQQNGPSFHYVHSDQWKYEKGFTEYDVLPPKSPLNKLHTIDIQAQAVRRGWLPFYPQFNVNPLELAPQAEKQGAKTNEEITNFVVQQLKDKKINFSVEDPDAQENWPRVWFIWRGNALMSSAKGHEYFLKHYLGTHSNAIGDENIAKDNINEVKWQENAPIGKFDLIVDLNFRMDTSALYSDIVLPAATWYEKNDLNTTDLHSYIHPMGMAVAPSWESKSDWEIFKQVSKKVSEIAAQYFSVPVKDVVSIALSHDTPDEISQPEIKEWKNGECEPIPGKTMPKIAVVERDYTKLYNKYISYGSLVRKNGIGVHGIKWQIEDLYDEILNTAPVVEWDGNKYPSIDNDVDAANIILWLAPETNGESCYRAFKAEEKKVGLPLTSIAEDYRGVKFSFDDICAQPRRILTSPCWSGNVNKGRAYAPFSLNIEYLIPWRTLTGRQHLYLDHRGYIDFGENLPTYKVKPAYQVMNDLSKSSRNGKVIILNYLTPHGKWHIHSTYHDNLRMLTLSRGIEPIWINDKDAEEIEVKDNDWVEAYNDNGSVCTRAAVSARIPRGVCILYHSPERTISVPKSQERGNKRAGGHNSLTRTRLKPVFMFGGYGQFSYAMNYWGPTGVNRDTFILVKKLEKLVW